MGKQTKGSIEADVANAIVRIHRDHQGRGPHIVKAQLAGDTILVRSSGIFTATEDKLSATEEGRSLINSARRELRAIAREAIEAEVGLVAEARVLRSFYDVNVQSAEQIEVYVFDEDIEKRLLRSDLDRYSATAPKRI